MARQSDRLSVSLQENLLVLACYSATAAPLIRNMVPVNLYGQQAYRDVVQRVYDYLDQYKKPPADHLPDLFDGELDKGGDAAQQLVELLEAVHSQRDKVNEQFTMGGLEKFVRQQTLKGSIIEASEALQGGELDKAELVLQQGLRSRLQIFQPGSKLEQGLALAFAGNVRRDVVPLGIKQFDDAKLGPAKGEFHLLMGPPKRGKSWWLVHVAKCALRARLKPLYITLELSEGQIHQRFLQSLFSITRHKAKVPVTRLRTDDLGRLLRFEKENIHNRLALDDPTAHKQIKAKLSRLYGRENLVVKQFPAGQLTVNGIEAYLDMLEQSTGYKPDVLCLDYADYMKLDPKNYRFEIGDVYNRLRGMAVERDLALVTAKRVNREGAASKMSTEFHAAEDYSAVYTADTIFTYSQTAAEKELGLARILASNSRVADRDGFVVLVSQAYPVGQFALDSAMLLDTYWGQLAQQGAAEPDTED